MHSVCFLQEMMTECIIKKHILTQFKVRDIIIRLLNILWMLMNSDYNVHFSTHNDQSLSQCNLHCGLCTLLMQGNMQCKATLITKLQCYITHFHFLRYIQLQTSFKSGWCCAPYLKSLSLILVTKWWFELQASYKHLRSLRQ